MEILRFIIFETFFLKISTSSPFFPITIPGLAVWIVISAAFVGLSTVILLTDASERDVFKKSFTFRSSFKKIATMENITFWKPVPINNYCAIGYIAYKKDKNPNNVLSCITIHKKLGI